MAGSLNHIVNDDGTFTMDFIENLGDAHEALEECYQLIYILADGNTEKVSKACNLIGVVNPWEIEFPDEQPKAPMKI